MLPVLALLGACTTSSLPPELSEMLPSGTLRPGTSRYKLVRQAAWPAPTLIKGPPPSGSREQIIARLVSGGRDYDSCEINHVPAGAGKASFVFYQSGDGVCDFLVEAKVEYPPRAIDDVRGIIAGVKAKLGEPNLKYDSVAGASANWSYPDRPRGGISVSGDSDSLTVSASAELNDILDLWLTSEGI